MSDSTTPVLLEKLVPGQKLNLSKAVGEAILSQIKIAIGWDPNEDKTGPEFDADVTVVLAKSDETTPLENVIFYQRLTSPDGSQKLNSATGNFEVVTPGYITHWGDNRTGAGEGDDETIDVELTKVPEEYDTLIVYVSIYKASERNQKFGMLNNAFIRVDDKSTGIAIAKCELDFDADTATTLRFGTFLRKSESWFFKAEKTAIDGGIQGILDTHVK